MKSKTQKAAAKLSYFNATHCPVNCIQFSSNIFNSNETFQDACFPSAGQEEQTIYTNKVKIPKFEL